ncbi:hypothetical protein Cob_v011089 [Colletotrichum orbiculare MAFF 240422]|uniref:Uncharacterized protein n=1 Tax=Colletotrichum orbiculare (strain 104-T / ATCC 96160 / CBS 514.97 / LARS 414 / MAFF 240422) TaxID=1213857 RepID=A0A484FCI5_COLOR|nr:hypothetical protein Cob_v011089 [Colletotrichum orbiculare MAFF 240422]
MILSQDSLYNVVLYRSSGEVRLKSPRFLFRLPSFMIRVSIRNHVYNLQNTRKVPPISPKLRSQVHSAS